MKKFVLIVLIVLIFPAYGVCGQYDCDDAIKALGRGDFKNTQLLLDEGLDVDCADRGGRTLLMQATISGSFDKVFYFITEYRASVDLQDGNGVSAIMIAVNAQHKNIVKLLIKYDARLDLEDKKGKTALDYAMKLKKREIENILRSHGDW